MKPRIRTIKPEAFTDEDLWDLEQETGLPIFRAFSGLWCHADREGRFEWRPRPLKAGVLPYWEGDFSRVLDALATRGFVVKYIADGREYGRIPGFTKHQVINNREEESKLPPPPLSDSESKRSSTLPRDDHATPTREARDDHASCAHSSGTEGKGRELEGNGREGRAPTRDDPTPQPVRPRNLEQALKMPIRERAAFAEREKHLASLLEPHQWPELKTFANAASEAMGASVVPLGTYERDSGVRALVALFAVFEPRDLARAITAIPGDPWFRTKRGLSAFSPEVVRRLLDGKQSAPSGATNGSKRQPDYPGEKTYSAAKALAEEEDPAA